MAQAIPIFIGAGQIGAGLLAADSIRRQGRMESIRHKFNAEMSEISAEDVLRRGEREANSVRRSGRAVRGSQRAAYAAQGVDVDSGSAADIQEETDILSEADSRTVRNNAWGTKPRRLIPEWRRFTPSIHRNRTQGERF